MSSRDQFTPSTPPPSGWNESAGFRETFLIHFRPPGYATALSILATMLHDYAMESSRHWPDPGESPTRLEMKAAAADLRWLSKHLAAVGREHEQSTLDPPDAALSRLGGQLADEVARLAERITRAVE